MKLSLQDLEAVVHQYFPRGLTPDDPGYDEAPELARQRAARVPASARYEAWRDMLRRLQARFPEEQFPGVAVESESYFLQSPAAAAHVDRCFTGVMWLPAGSAGEENHRIVFLVSFVVPCYALRSERHVHMTNSDGTSDLDLQVSFDLSSGERPFVEAIQEEIEHTFPGHELIAPEVGLTVVPDVVTGSKWFGEATIFTCLFSDRW